MKRIPIILLFCALLALAAQSPSELARKHIQAMTEDGSLTNVVNELIQSGTICKVRGHKWECGDGIVGSLVMYSGEVRHFSVCGLVQIKTPGQWPGE